MRKNLLGLFLIIFCTPILVTGQCVGGTLDAAIIPTNAWQTVTSHAGKYFTFAATAGNVYIFSYCPCEGGSIGYAAELSLDSTAALSVNGRYDDVNYNYGFCGDANNGPRISWKCFTSGTYRVLSTHQWCTDTPHTTATLVYKTEIPSVCYTVASMAHAPDPYNAGTAISILTNNKDDGLSNYFPIGFAFCFNGISYNTIWVSSNGYITFKNSCDILREDTINYFPPSSYTLYPLPFVNSTLTQIIGPGVLFPWIDAQPGLGGSVHYQVYGVAPNRHLTVGFNKVPMYQ